MTKKVRHVSNGQPGRARGKSKGTRPSTPAPPPTSKVSSADALHRPVKVAVAPEGSLRTRINRVLPPFSVQRYLAIWVLGMIPLIGIILVLARPWDTESRQASRRATPTASVSSLTATTVITATAGRTPTQGAAALAAFSITPTLAPITATVGFNSTERYLVVETSKGRVVARLRTSPAEGVVRSVGEFIERVASGYFDGQPIHRVERWMVQGGDPHDTSRIPAEYNLVPFGPGTLALAHGADPAYNSDTQFIIVKTETPALDGEYTNLGQVVEGMEVVNKWTEGDKIDRVLVTDRP
jgi:peptidylprolyl isomerase